MAENINVTKDEFSNLELQAGLNIENASYFYSFIENNHKISGNSPIYSEVISQVKNSDNNKFLINANKHQNFKDKAGYTITTQSNLIDTNLYSDATSSFTTFRDKILEEFLEDLIEEIEEIFDDDEVEDLLKDLDLELFYKIEISETINKYEFNELLNKSNIYLKPNDLDNLFRTFDRNENEEIDYYELIVFIEYIKKLKKRRTKNNKNFKNNYNVTDIINIDTRFRNNYYDTLSTDFTYVLPEIQNKVKQISIGSIEMPMTHYNVSSKLKNNTMLIISDSNNITINKDISSSWEFKSQIGCLSGNFEHGGFIFDNDKTSVSYDSSTIIISESTIGVSGDLYNNKWWDGSAVQTINTWDTSIVPVEFIDFNNKDPPTLSDIGINELSNNTTRLSYYSDLEVLIEEEGITTQLPGLGNINDNTTQSVYLNTRFVPFSYYLENTNKQVKLRNSPFMNELIYKEILKLDTAGGDNLIADTYTSTYYTPPQQRIDDDLRRIDICNNVNNTDASSIKNINYFPSSIFGYLGDFYPEDSSGNIIWGWSGQTKTDTYKYFNQTLDFSKAQVKTTPDITSSETILKKRYYSTNYEQYLDLSSIDILKNYYAKSDFDIDPLWGKWFDISNTNNFIQNEFFSHEDLPFGHNKVEVIEISNIKVNENGKKTSIINTTEITNYDTLTREILVEATPSLLELSNNDISKSFINAIDGWFNDSSGGGYNDNGMREEFSVFKADISVNMQQTLFDLSFNNEGDAKNYIKNNPNSLGYVYNIDDLTENYKVYTTEKTLAGAGALNGTGGDQGDASASSYYNVDFMDFTAPSAFNDELTHYDAWVSDIQTTPLSTDDPHWIQFEFPYDVIVTKYTIWPRQPSSTANNATDWELRGIEHDVTYNPSDISTYTLLDSRSGVNSWQATSTSSIANNTNNESFVPNNNITAACRKFRLHITASSPNGYFVNIGELAFYGYKYNQYVISNLKLHDVAISDISSRLVTYNKYKPLTKYTLYDTFSWGEHDLDISNQKAGINSKHKINNYFLQGSPNRTDICWNTITYVHGDPIEPPFDSSHNIETYKKTKIVEDIHVKYYDYYDLKTEKDISFSPVKFAWLATLPDGNYDETWKTSKNIFEVENIVNNSISLAIPGAIDYGGNFAAIKNNDKLKWYNWLNNYKNKNNIVNFNSRFFDRFPEKRKKMFAMSSLNLKDIQFSVDKITGKSVFATKTNIINSNNINYKLDSVITKVDTFTTRFGHTSLRSFDNLDLPQRNDGTFTEYQDLSLSKPSGNITPEISLLISKAKQPIIESYPNLKNKKMIYSVRFNVDEYGNTDLETNIQLKLGWVLGFRGAEYILGDVDNTNIIYNPNSVDYTPPTSNYN